MSTQAQIDQENAELRIGSIVRDGENRMFERFDDLHQRNITDDTIIRVLRGNGRPELAAQYIEWSGAIDPDREDDNTTMSPTVPDPGDAPSYEALEQAWERGMADAKLQALGIKPLVRNPYLAEEGK